MKPRATTLILCGILLIGGGVLGYSIHIRRMKASAAEHFVEADRLQRMGNLPDAIQRMKLAVESDPAYLEARQGLSDLYELNHQVRESIEVLDEGIRRDPANEGKYCLLLCDLYDRQKQYDKAVEHLKRGLSKEPPNMAAERKLPLLYESARKWEDAIQAWKEFERKFPEESSSRRGLARIERNRKKAQEQPGKPGKTEPVPNTASKGTP